MYTWILRIITSGIIAVFSTSFAQDVANVSIAAGVVQTNNVVELYRLLLASFTGVVVQTLTIFANGKWFSRIEGVKTKQKKLQTKITSIAEILLAGIASAIVVGVLRGVFSLDWGYSGEFAVAAFCGSLGSEYVFKWLEKRVNAATKKIDNQLGSGNPKND